MAIGNPGLSPKVRGRDVTPLPRVDTVVVGVAERHGSTPRYECGLLEDPIGLPTISS